MAKTTRKSTSCVYILHFTRPVCGRVTHYIGSAKNFEHRMNEHRSTMDGALLCRLAGEQGISFYAFKIKPGGWQQERLFKRSRHHERYCPLCKGTKTIEDGLLVEPIAGRIRSTETEELEDPF